MSCKEKVNEVRILGGLIVSLLWWQCMVVVLCRWLSISNGGGYMASLVAAVAIWHHQLQRWLCGISGVADATSPLVRIT